MEELPVEDPAHMATAERQLHDWENFIRGKKLTDDTSGEDVCFRNPSPQRPAFLSLSLSLPFSIPLRENG